MFKKDFPWNKIARTITEIAFYLVLIVGIVNAIVLLAKGAILIALLTLGVYVVSAIVSVCFAMMLCDMADNLEAMKKARKAAHSRKVPSWVCKCGTRNIGNKNVCENCGRERE